jgi:hypothetical protein
LVRNRFQRWVGRRSGASGVHRGRRSFAIRSLHNIHASFNRQHPSILRIRIYSSQLRAFMRLSLTPVTIDFLPTDCTS